MRDAVRADDAGLLELDAPDVLEEPRAGAEQDRRDVDLELVEQPGAEVLLRDLGAARDLDVLVAGGLAREVERGLDAVGDEGERRSL